MCSRDSVHVVDVPYSIIAKEQVEGQSNFVKVQKNSVKGPQVCWLLSYPNSGTSFTMKLVGQTSNTTVATNYGLECDFDGKGENVPLHSDSPHGPYLLHPNRRLPENYILSKTHCGGRCNDCGPSNYLETKESFLKMCAKGSHVSASNATKHEKAKKGRSDWLERYPNSVGGFREWCRYLDQKYAEEESSMEQFPPSMIELFHRIPCHKAFYAFAQWHKLAIGVVEDLRLPRLLIYYENYEKDFNATVDAIFDFLELSPVAVNPPFVPGKEYIEYFSPEEIQAAKTLVQTVSDPQSWKLIDRYFKK
eukprot:scaffold410_cov267-Chaetoceros_neogracile.AAC.10